MTEGFTYKFPAKIGETVYIVSRAGFIHENTVDGYIVVCGENPHDNRVRLTYFDRDGVRQTHYRNLNLFGKTIFVSRRAAEEAANESSCSL